MTSIEVIVTSQSGSIPTNNRRALKEIEVPLIVFGIKLVYTPPPKSFSASGSVHCGAGELSPML